METKIDTSKIQLLSDEYKINQTSDKIIVIEQKEKEPKQKEFYETTLFMSFIFPVLITLIVFFITRFITRRKDKAERELINEEINQLKRDFQPYVLSTLQKTQETILNDKINALREIVKFKTDFFTYSEIEINEDDIEENVDENNEEYNVYMLNIYDKKLFDDFEKIVLLNGYLFPNDIMYSLNSIRNDIGILVSVIDSNLNNNETTNEQLLINNLSSKFDNVIEEIRKDLHLDDKFIHDFIEKYKKP